MRLYDQISGKNVQRIEALSDGVFAIALTLLVLDIRVPIREWLNLFFLGIMLGRILHYAEKHNYLKGNTHERTEVKKAMIRRGMLAQSLCLWGATLFYKHVFKHSCSDHYSALFRSGIVFGIAIGCCA